MLCPKFRVKALVPKAVFAAMFMIFLFTSLSTAKADSPQPKILVVADAHYLDDNSEVLPIYENALQANGYTYDVYIVAGGRDNGPSLSVLNQYDIVVWFTSNDGKSSLYITLTQEDENNLKSYLNNGGRLFLTGQEIGMDRGSDPDGTGFYPDYLHAYFCQDDADYQTLTGLTGNPIGDDLWIYHTNAWPSVVYYREDRTGSCQNTWEIFCTDNDKIYRRTNTAFRYYYTYGGIKCDNGENINWPVSDYANGAITFDSGGPEGYKLVYFAFEFEEIQKILSSADRKTIMKRVIEYLSAPDTKNSAISPNITNSNLTLTAICVDEQHLSHVAGAEYFVDSKPGVATRGTPLSASDGAFNEQTEPVESVVDISSLQDGNHTIYVRCKDEDGYWGKFDSVNFTKDTVPPAAPFILIENDEIYTNKEKPALAIIDSSAGNESLKPDYIRFSCNSISWSSWVPWTTSYSNFNITSGAGCNNSDGTKTVYVQAKDEAGNVQSTVRSDEIILDRVNPSILSISPRNNSYINSSVNITVEVNDDRSGVNPDALLFNNGTANQSFANNKSFNPGWSEGLNELIIYASDNASNSIVEKYFYTVDDTPPSTSDNSTSSWKGKNQNIKLSCTDSISSCSFVEYCIGNISCLPLTVANISQDFIVNVSCPQGTACQQYIRYRSNDSAGNFESVKTSKAIKIDKKNPEVFVHMPSPGLKTGGITINATVSDTDSGLEAIGFNITNDTFSEFRTLLFDGNYWIGALDTEGFADGPYNITIYANDTAGNMNNSERVEIIIDNNAPITTDNSTGNWSSENQTILLECIDSASACSFIKYCIGPVNCTLNTVQDISLGNISLEIGCNQNQACQQYVRYRSNDSAGNLESVKTSKAIKIDKKNPEIVISSPKQNQILSGTVDIITEISDSDSGIKPEANYTILNATTLEVIAQGTLNESGQWDAKWNSAGNEGQLILNITAMDNVGNIGKKNVTFIIDNQEPSAVIIVPREEFKNQSFNIELKGTRPGNKNLTNASYYIKNSSGILQSNITTNINKQNFTFTDFINFSDPKWADGNYTINFSVFDELGKEANDTSWFFIDRQSPITSDDSDGKWHANDVEISLNCTDNSGECEATFYCVNTSGVCQSFQQYIGRFIITCQDNEVCNKTVKYYSEDSAGNVEAIRSSLPVLIDKKAPTTIDNSTGNWTNKNQSIILNATDNGSGVNATFYCVDETGICQPNLIYTSPVKIGCDQNSSCKKYVRYRSNDSVGNLESVKTSKAIKIDKKAPNSTINPNSKDWSANNVNFSIICEDSDSGCSQTFYIILNESESCPSSGFVPGNSGTITCGFGQSCIKKVCFFSQDSAGNNESVKESSAFKIDFEPPSATNLSLNISFDQFHGDRRIYPNENVEFNISLYDARNISTAILEINGINYTMERISGSDSYGIWQTKAINTSGLGLYNFKNIYVNDSLGNLLILNSSEINMSFIVVNGSLTVLLNNSTSVNARESISLSLIFHFNITAENPFLEIAVPSNYINSTSYICSFGSSCAENAEIENGRVVLLNVTGQGKGQNLTIFSSLQAESPENDTSDSWILKYKNFAYVATTHIKAPLLNISNISCNVPGCSPDQNQSFNITVIVNNTRDNFHTGNISLAVLNVSSSIANKSLAIGNLPSNRSSEVSFNFTIEDAGNYTFRFVVSGDKEYNDSAEINISVRDSEKPNITILEFVEDNIINPNSTIDLSAEVTDNVAVDSVWITVQRNSSENATFSFESGSKKNGVWTLSYDNATEPGIYNLTKIYANDTSGNIFSINPGNFSPSLSYFEVRELALNLTLEKETVSLGQNQTINLEIRGNGSAVTNISLTIMKPRNVNETLNLLFVNASNNTLLYSATYSNVSRSGNYSVKAEVTAGGKKSAEKKFFVPFGNISIKKSQTNLSVLNGSLNNISWIIVPANGDIINATISLSSSNTSIVQVNTNSQEGIDITYEQYPKGRAIQFPIRALAIGEVNLTINASAVTSSSLKVPLKVIANDTISPKIIGISQDFSVVNLLEPIEIEANFTDNALVKGILEINYPNSSITENFSMNSADTNKFSVLFKNTSKTGTYNYKVIIQDVGNNTGFIEGNFSVSSEYKTAIFLDKKKYNKGEKIFMDFDVKNINGKPVKNYNLTVILDKAGINETVENNSKKTSSAYFIKASDPPSGDSPSVYTLYLKIEKSGNIGRNETSFNVSRLLNTKFLRPHELETFKVGEEVPLRVNITNVRGEPVGSASVIARCIACKESGGKEFLELKFNSTTKLYHSDSFKAPETENNKFTIAVYSMDQFKNYQGDPSSPPFVALSTETSVSAPLTKSAGGGGGGGETVIMPLSVEILSPKDSVLPFDTKKVELKIKTSEKAQCEYSKQKFEFGEGISFSTNDGIVHTASVKVESGKSYTFRIKCKAGEIVGEEAIAFIVSEKEIFDFEVSLADVIQIIQGENETVYALLSNKGNVPIKVKLGLVKKECCTINFKEEVVIEEKMELSTPVRLHAPLNTSPGAYNIILKFKNGTVIKERTLRIEVKENQNIKMLKELYSKINSTEMEIGTYKNSGVNTRALEIKLEKVKTLLKSAEKAVRHDSLRDLEEYITEARKEYQEITRTLLALKLVKFFKDNWWKLIAGFLLIYTIFYSVTLIFIPYISLRQRINSLRAEEREHIQTRKKIEQQYFNRLIDHSTFMKIMTNKQREILRVRGAIDEAERKINTLLKDRLNLKTFLKAPVVAIYEIGEWRRMKMTKEEVKEERKR